MAGARVADEPTLLAFIEEVAPAHPALARRLYPMVHDFAFEEIVQLAAAG